MLAKTDALEGVLQDTVMQDVDVSPDDPTPDPAGDDPGQENPASHAHPLVLTAQAEALGTLVQATLTPVVTPLVAELAAYRQTVERQAEVLAALREERGRLAERVAGLERELAAPREPGEPPLSPAAGTHRRLSWRRVLQLVLLAAVVIGVVLIVVLLLFVVPPLDTYL
jgi:hypothetical protein